MPTYQVERILPGADLESLMALCRSADEVARRFVAEGRFVRYLRSTFTPGDSRCRCLFEAVDGDLVREVNDAAHLPYSRVVLAIELPLGRPP
jgi:hypothetical protein